ncbi:MAG: hypothetical protein RR037_06175 [Alistipes sp.]
MEKIPEEILAHVTEVYGYDRELFEKMVDAFDMGDDGCFTVRDENQNIRAFCFIAYTNYFYYGHVLKAVLGSCLGVTKYGDGKDIIKVMHQANRFAAHKVDVITLEALTERLVKIHQRITDSAFVGGNREERLTQEEALAYPKNDDVSLRILTADEFYPLYEQWIREQDYQFAMIFSYDNIKKLEECIHLIAAYDTNGKVVGLTIVHKEEHYFSEHLEPMAFEAIDDRVRKAMIRYLAENYNQNHDGRNLLIRTYGKTDDPDFVVSALMIASNVYKMLGIYAQAHPHEHRIIHLVSDRDPEVDDYYTISEGVATYTKEPIEGAERMTHKELSRLLIPYSNCCFFF